MNEAQLYGIFPTAVMVAHYKKINEVLDVVKQMPEEKLNITGYFGTMDYEILKNPKFDDLNKFILDALKVYVSNVYKYDSKLYITQSWINRNKKGKGHHEHIHSNSIISGVLFLGDTTTLKEGEKFPPIKFAKNTFNALQLPLLNDDKKTYEVTSFNNPYHAFDFYPGNLILFPSSLRHSVPNNESSGDRYALSFNTFCTTLGDKMQLNFLNIPVAKI